MLVSDFDFALPDELIAQHPPAERGRSRLLVVPRGDGALVHSQMPSLPGFLRAGDLLVVNNTRVFPARLLGRREPGGGAVECLLVTRLDDDGGPGERWEALLHPGQKLKPGARVTFDGATPLHGEILERKFFGRRTIRLWSPDGLPVQQVAEQIGHIPLPPYIRRDDTAADRERYQTVFASRGGSIAAPTAGLHFTPVLLQQLRDAGIEIAEVTLDVGYGTFQPVRVEAVDAHRVEAEMCEISDAAASAVNAALDDRRRVVAVGTTTTRTLESSARQHGGRIAPGRSRTDLFIYPGFEFRVLGGLLTNFHLPKSSLLMLVAAFGGHERVLSAYREAVRHGYRFYSYGDAMLLT